MAGAQDRATGGQAPRLTRQLIEDVVASLRTGTAIQWACGFVWINRDTYLDWQKTALTAAAKRPAQRTQKDRLCIEFAARTRQAISDHAMRSTMQLASAGGLTRERPKRRRTTQRILSRGDQPLTIDAEGNVSGGTLVEVQIIEEELAADWHAVDRYMARRHREEWTGGPVASDQELGAAEVPHEVTNDQLFSLLDRARQRAGIDLGVIEARSFDVPDGPAELSEASYEPEAEG